MLDIYFTSINSKTRTGLTLYFQFVISEKQAYFSTTLFFFPQKFKMPKTSDRRTESNSHLCACGLPGDGVCHFSLLWMGHTFLLLCTLCNFLMRTRYIEYHKVVTLEIRFSHPPRDFFCCFYFYFSCLFSELTRLFLQILYCLSGVVTETSISYLYGQSVMSLRFPWMAGSNKKKNNKGVLITYSGIRKPLQEHGSLYYHCLILDLRMGLGSDSFYAKDPKSLKCTHLFLYQALSGVLQKFG